VVNSLFCDLCDVCGEKQFGYFTAEARRAQRKEFLIDKEYSELGVLSVSAVNSAFFVPSG
jgi:hypothetical protein